MASETSVMVRSAPFETPPTAAPQDKLARLEPRTIALQLFFRGMTQFPDSLAGRGPRLPFLRPLRVRAVQPYDIGIALVIRALPQSTMADEATGWSG